jgi:hypothetical protein
MLEEPTVEEEPQAMQEVPVCERFIVEDHLKCTTKIFNSVSNMTLHNPYTDCC